MSNLSSAATSTSTALVPLKGSSIAFPKNSVYIRILSPEECKAPDVIAMIQKSENEINEVFGVFNMMGERIGAGADCELATEASVNAGLQAQLLQ